MDLIIIEIIIVIFLIFISSFLSAAEVAIASFGANKIEDLKERNDKSADAFEAIQNNYDNFFGTIQLITTFSLFLSALISFSLILDFITNIFEASQLSLLIISFLITAFIFSILTLVFVTLIPKVIGFKYSGEIGKLSAGALLFLTRIFSLPAKLITVAANSILFLLKEKTSFSQTRLSEDEIRIIISEGVKSGALDETEKEIIENIFEFNDLRANEVMIPRTEMAAIEMTDDYEQIKKDILNTRHSLLPVYTDSVDNIIGILHSKNIIRSFIQQEKVDIKSLIGPVYFVPDKKLISEILKEMQKRGERLAVVTDEYGGTEGIITMEDILEEIVGDFGNNNKLDQPEFNKMPNGQYSILGTMYIEDFNENFNYDLPESEEYNTIAGFVAEKTGKILNTGETFEFLDLKFELIKKIRQKMVQFKVYSTGIDFHEVPKRQA